jgi:condensin complex subunit 3
MLGHPQLPPGLIEHCLNVLKKIMPSERDLIRVIVEIIVELREGEDDAENADNPQALVGFFCLLMLSRKKKKKN